MQFKDNKIMKMKNDSKGWRNKEKVNFVYFNISTQFTQNVASLIIYYKVIWIIYII